MSAFAPSAKRRAEALLGRDSGEGDGQAVRKRLRVPEDWIHTAAASTMVSSWMMGIDGIFEYFDALQTADRQLQG
jgi:hypothetical protein